MTKSAEDFIEMYKNNLLDSNVTELKETFKESNPYQEIWNVTYIKYTYTSRFLELTHKADLGLGKEQMSINEIIEYAILLVYRASQVTDNATVGRMIQLNTQLADYIAGL